MARLTGSRVTVVTAGHLATCPRMVKAADALAAAGHRIRVVSVQHTAWATAVDEELRRARASAWRWTTVRYGRRQDSFTYLSSGVRARAARALVAAAGPSRCPLPLCVRAHSRVHAELVRAIVSEDADLIYGGTAGAITAVAEAGRRRRVPYALDLEDFHCGERGPGPAGRFESGLVERVEGASLPGASFLTASSPAIASAYAAKYGLQPIAVHNTFPLPVAAPDPAPSPGAGLRLYWVSQTIGPGRGLEDVVAAMGLAGTAGELHLRGRPIEQYVESLRRRSEGVAPQLMIVHHDYGAPDRMVELCEGMDVGLAVEPGSSLNNRLALSNKLFTYLLGGLAVAVTDTPGQRQVALALGDAAILYRPGDVAGLAAGFRRWADDKGALARARAGAFDAARRRWHWEHAEDRGALLAAVSGVLDR